MTVRVKGRMSIDFEGDVNVDPKLIEELGYDSVESYICNELTPTMIEGITTYSDYEIYDIK